MLIFAGPRARLLAGWVSLPQNLKSSPSHSHRALARWQAAGTDGWTVLTVWFSIDHWVGPKKLNKQLAEKPLKRFLNQLQLWVTGLKPGVNDKYASDSSGNGGLSVSFALPFLLTFHLTAPPIQLQVELPRSLRRHTSEYPRVSREGQWNLGQVVHAHPAGHCDCRNLR